MRSPNRLIAAALCVALAQIGFFAWQLHSRAGILRTGTEVLLRVEPIDPRDLLRGEYVTLAYDISRLPRELAAGEAAPEVSDDVWVRVGPGEDGANAARAVSLDDAFAEPPGEGEADLLGAVAWAGPDEFGVDYGIERYYVPEGEAAAIEAPRAARDLKVLIAVRDGRSQIKALFAGGQPLYREPPY